MGCVIRALAFGMLGAVVGYAGCVVAYDRFAAWYVRWRYKQRMRDSTPFHPEVPRGRSRNG